MYTVLADHACDPQTKFGKLNSDRYDVLSIPNHVIKKGPSHGRRHGNTERQRIFHQAHVSSRKATKKGYASIRDRFLRYTIYRQSQLDVGWAEGHCARLDEIAAEDHSYIATAAERARRGNTWVLVLNSSGPNGPMNQREDYEAKKMCQRLYQESGQAHHRLHPREQVRMRPEQPFAWHEGSERVDPKTGGSGTTLSQQQASSGWQPYAWQSSWSQRSTFTRRQIE